MKKYQALKPLEFLKDLELEASKAKERVWLQAMYFLPTPKTAVIAKLLKSSAKRGLDTQLQFDCISFVETDPKASFIAKKLIKIDPKVKNRAKRHQHKLEILNQLSKSGVKLKYLNPIKGLEHYLPIKGRNHIKLNIIDNIAYVGGINYGFKDFNNIDFMVKIHNQELVKELSKIYQSITQDKLEKDRTIKVSKDVQIWLDAGNPNKSIILENTLKEIRKANKEIWYTGQFPPDGAYLKELIKAKKRGSKITLILSKVSHNDFITQTLNILSKKYVYIRGKEFKIVEAPKMVHSKLTLIDQETLIFGSHNYSRSGVLLGTAELNLKIKSKMLAKEIKNIYKDYI